MQIFDSQKFKTRDATSYDSVTEQFDFFTERLSSLLAARLISLAAIKASDSVLDIGTGTGVVALQAAKKLGGGGKVVGIDLSEGMLATAAEKAKKLGLAETVEFSRMDAEALQFADESFDTVVSLFALLHFPVVREASTILRHASTEFARGFSQRTCLPASSADIVISS